MTDPRAEAFEKAMDEEGPISEAISSVHYYTQDEAEELIAKPSFNAGWDASRAQTRLDTLAEVVAVLEPMLAEAEKVVGMLTGMDSQLGVQGQAGGFKAAIAAVRELAARDNTSRDERSSPTYWPGQADREEVGPIGDGTPHARMSWFWERMRQHEALIQKLTGWSPLSSSYRFEAAIADAFDRLAARDSQGGGE
jgi:hypothetical protein